MGKPAPGTLALVPGVTNPIAATGIFGAVAGGAVAAVGNSVRVARGEITGPEALSNVAKEGVGTGLSAAAGMAAMRALGYGGIVGFVAFFAAAGLAKSLWDAVAAPAKKAPGKAPAAE